MRKLIVLLLTLVALAVSFAPIAGASPPPWAPNNGSPGNFNNCTGVNNSGGPHSGWANYNTGQAYHACD